MKTRTIKQIAVIQEDNAKAFQDAFNSTIKALAKNNPQHEINMTNGFCAIITYDEALREVDCVADEYHADGIYYNCADCPLHEAVTDGRKKKIPCTHSTSGYCRMDNEACEVFYRRMKMGDIVPNGEPHTLKKDSFRKENYLDIRDGIIAV